VQPCKEGFPWERAVDLFMNGWKSVSNIWDASDGNFASIEEVKRKFSISTEDERIYAKVASKLEAKWGEVLQSSDGSYPVGEWVGVFGGDDPLPSIVFQVSPSFRPM
jgi:hypothetical protein